MIRPRGVDSSCMLKPMRLRALLVAALLAILPTSLGSDGLVGDAKDPPFAAALDAWPGWRGQTAEGRALRPLPIRWATDNGFRWKTPVPGRGHSSPIVFGDRAYVTTAYQTVSGLLLQNVLRALTLGLVLAVVALTLQAVANSCWNMAARPRRNLASNVAIVAAAVMLAVIGSSGDAMLDLSRSPMRQWMASTLFVSVCFGLIALVAETRGLQLMTGLIAVTFSAITLYAFPSPDYAFRGGLLSLRMQIAVATSAVPLLVGLCAVLSVSASPRATAIQRVVIACVAVAAIAGGWMLLHHVLVFRDESFPETSYAPRLSLWSLALAAAALGILWLARRGRPSFPMTLAAVWLGGVSVVLAGAVAVELLATRSPYLAYQLGSRQPDSSPSGLRLAGAGVIVVGLFAWARGGSLQCVRSRRRVSTALAIVVLALGGVFFIRANYVHPITHLVRAIVSIDRESGRIAWILEGLGGPTESMDGRNSPATPTPATNGRLVCAYFGTPGLMCADRDGRLEWARTDLPYEGLYGAAVSPLLANGIVVLVRDTPAGAAFVDALDASTGATQWTRTFPTTPTFSGNSRTPLLRELDGQQTLILWGMNYVKALTLNAGDLLWSYDSSSAGDIVSSAISDTERLYLSDASGTVALDLAALAAGRDPVRWRSDARANCVSPVLVNGILLTVTDSGVATATRAATGERLWRHRLAGQYFASLIASPDVVYFTNSDGVTTVVAADSTFRIVAENRLGEETVASMASAGGDLFIRSIGHLYAIGDD